MTDSQTLVGSDNLRQPYWATVDESVSKASLWRIARTAPHVAALILRRAWQTSPIWTAIAILLQVASGLVTALGVLVTAVAFDELFTGGADAERLIAAAPKLLIVMAAFAVNALLDGAVKAVQAFLTPRIEMAVRDEMLQSVASVGLVDFDDPDFVDLVRRATTDGVAQIRYSVGATCQVAGASVSMTAAAVGAALLHPLLAPLVLLSAIPQAWASVKSGHLGYQAFLDTNAINRRLAVIGNLLTGRRDAAELRAHGAREAILGQHRALAGQLVHHVISMEWRKTRINLAGRGVRGIGIGLAYAVLALLIVTGDLPLGIAGAAVLAVRTASAATQQAVEFADMLYEASFYIALYESCLRDARRRSTTGTGRDAPRPRRVRLHDVGFRYPGSDGWAVEDVSLDLAAGEIVALVGENGSGKSTLAKIIAGLYRPGRGVIYWNAEDRACYSDDAVARHVGVVMQDPSRWPMTAENNVRIGRLDHRDEDGRHLNDAASRSGVIDVVDKLPQGFGTLLSPQFQDGIDLSVGQWQRFGVARGIYRNAGLVVADEPTAALDVYAEAAVIRSLWELGRATKEPRITVIVTHRLSSVRNADKVVMLSRGRIVGCGPHDELMARCPEYAELYRAQLTDPSPDPSSRGRR